MLDGLEETLENGLIDLGRKREVVMRLLLRKAYMDAIVAEQGQEDPHFSRGCSFLEFLKALLAQPYDTQVQGCMPDNIHTNHPSRPKSEPLGTAFKDAVVRFTHFTRAADDSTMTMTGMVMGFLRGAAIIGPVYQEMVDVAIPILMHKDRKIEHAEMSMLLVQVVRREEWGTTKGYTIDATKTRFFSENVVTPYVTLVAELDPVFQKDGQRGPKVNVKFGKLSGKSSSRIDAKAPRYSIRTYECTPETWNVVAPGEKNAYDRIMGLDAFSEDRPWRDLATLGFVYRMLPGWRAKSDWFAEETEEEDVEMDVETDTDEHDDD